MAKLSAKVPSLGAIRTSPCTSWDTPPSGGRTSRMRSVSETAKTPSLIPSVRSVRYFRPVLGLSSFDEPSPLMKLSRQLPFDPAVGAGQRIAFRASRVVSACEDALGDRPTQPPSASRDQPYVRHGMPRITKR